MAQGSGFDEACERLLALVQDHWDAWREAARASFAEHGKGLFCLDVRGPESKLSSPRTSVPYRNRAALKDHIGDDAWLALLCVDQYDRAREIAFLLEDRSTGKAKTHVLSEDSSGVPEREDDGSEAEKEGVPQAAPIVGRPRTAEARDLNELLDALEELVCADLEESLSEEERLVWDLTNVGLEVSNGGFFQYFENKGHRAASALRGFALIGATEAAEVFRKACSPFPHGVPAHDPDEASSQIDDLGDEAYELWEELDERFDDANAKTSELVWRYWRGKNRD